MTKWKNISGVAVAIPTVHDHDVAPGEVVEVPDDVVMAPNYFSQVAFEPVGPAPADDDEE